MGGLSKIVEDWGHFTEIFNFLRIQVASTCVSIDPRDFKEHL